MCVGRRGQVDAGAQVRCGTAESKLCGGWLRLVFQLIYYCIDCQSKAAWSQHKVVCVPKRNMVDVMRLTEPEQALQLSADTDLSFDLLVKNLDLDLLENTLKAIDSAAAAEEPTFYPRNAPARTRTATVAAAAAVLAAGQQEQPAPSPNTPLLEMGLSEDQVLTCSVTKLLYRSSQLFRSAVAETRSWNRGSVSAD